VKKKAQIPIIQGELGAIAHKNDIIQAFFLRIT
jgi:hypothetical protein